MNIKKYNWILYLITATIITTVTVQLYWNYKNFQENRKRITNEIQISLDNAVEEYFSNLSKENFFAVISFDSLKGTDSIFERLWLENDSFKKDSTKVQITSLKFRSDDHIGHEKTPRIIDSLLKTDSLYSRSITINHANTVSKNVEYPIRLKAGRRLSDSIKVIKGIQSVYTALTNDDLNFSELDSLFYHQIETKGISADYYFNFIDHDSVLETTQEDLKNNLQLYTNSLSTYLRPTQELRLYHSDPTLAALKKSSTGILLSLLLSLTVISSLFYLLKIIKKQKELAEIKNDLISNITHEFKTPIATISTAIEAIENFNVIDDKKKTQKYLSMSSLQLKKLHQMVEKLLETSTLDSENLLLKKEEIDIVDLVIRATNKHRLLTDKKINFSSNINAKFLKTDLFHFENAISNLVDNAIKYGGETIEVNINAVLNNVEISVADDGNGIEKNQQEKIFDKFYRIPKGNRHDVKGFGIGLYYSKKIVEKHSGSIHLASNNLNTIFKISLPNG